MSGRGCSSTLLGGLAPDPGCDRYDPSMFTTRPELRGTFGMVSSTHWIASQAGMAVLERGGNAFDAAGAARFVLPGVQPRLNGLGGEVPLLLLDSCHPTLPGIFRQRPAPAAP